MFYDNNVRIPRFAVLCILKHHTKHGSPMKHTWIVLSKGERCTIVNAGSRRWPQGKTSAFCQILDIMYFLFSTAVSGVGSSPALATCETWQILLAGVPGGFPGVLPFRPTYRLARLYEWNNLERDIKLNKKAIKIKLNQCWVRGWICQRRPTDITSGNYHGEMNSEKFIDLLRGKLIPNLPPKSLVVIDNASYHCVQEDKCPTQASRKADMQAWLTKHNVAWSNDMLKVELLELCKTHRP